MEITYLNHWELLTEEFLTTLEALRPVGLALENAKTKFIENRLKTKSYTYVAKENGVVIGTASLLIEGKLIHQGGVVGHIEDVAVHKDHQGKGVGKALLQKLVEDAKTYFGCYKVILDCTPDLIPFYEKNGFEQVGVCMRMTLK